MAPTMTEPRQPERTRLVRPDLYRDEVTGPLTPAQRDAYLGIATLTDDSGWALWRPQAIAASIYPYVSPAKRVRDLEARAATLRAAGLLVLFDCGCAYLPRAKRDLVISGGKQIRQVEAFHQAHGTDQSVSVPGDPDWSGTSTSSSSLASSDSWSSTASSSSVVDVAREAEANSNGHTQPIGVGRPFDGTKKTKTMVTNEDLPAHLRVVQVPR